MNTYVCLSASLTDILFVRPSVSGPSDSRPSSSKNTWKQHCENISNNFVRIFFLRLGKSKEKIRKKLKSKFMKSFPNHSLFFTWKILFQFLLQLSLQTSDHFNDENIFSKFWKTKMNNLIKWFFPAWTTNCQVKLSWRKRLAY